MDLTRKSAAKRGIPRQAQAKGKSKDHVRVAALCGPCNGSGRATLPLMALKGKSLALVILRRFTGYPAAPAKVKA